MNKVRLTAAQACVRYLANQYIADDGDEVPFFLGAWAIFGHGNVAGIGEALARYSDQLPTYRAHNEQAMAHAAIAYAKQKRRRRAMICTTSIGPGATNMITAAALAHVNRLPVLFLPGDVYASRRPDPVLQQVEDFGDGTLSANDCFRPVSRYFDRITRPEQVMDALPRAMAMMLNPASCGPATIAFCQDVQAEAFECSSEFFERKVWRISSQQADEGELDAIASAVREASAPLLIAGGGVHYSGACDALANFAQQTGIPVVETQAGKGSLLWDHPLMLGGIGVTGTSAANAAAAEADLIVGVGTRLQDFTTGSWALFQNPGRRIAQINVNTHDAHKGGAIAVRGDARAVLKALSERLAGWQVSGAWTARVSPAVSSWNADWEAATAPPQSDGLPSDAQVIGAVWRSFGPEAVIVGAAGGLPGELHKLWRSRSSDDYHVEYGYSCMGYEIAGALGVQLAAPERQVVAMLGDGSYLMMNSELATSVMLGAKIILVVLDNRGFGCINRLQKGTGSAPFNNLLADARQAAPADVDFVAHARALGALAEKAATIAELDAALARAAAADRSYVVVIDTDPDISTAAGGAWWDVAVPEVSERAEVRAARKDYEEQLQRVRK